LDRSVDELKDRYYKICKAILLVRGQNNHPIVQKPFDMELEARRKWNLEKLFTRTKEQLEKTKLYVQEIKKIEGKIKKEEKAASDLARLI